MRLIEYAVKRKYGITVLLTEANWSRLPIHMKFVDLNYNSFWFRIDGMIYNWNSQKFKKAFEEARAWELLAK